VTDHTTKDTDREPTPEEQAELFRLSNIRPREVSIVDRPANQEPFTVVKRHQGDPMATEIIEKEDGTLTIKDADQDTEKAKGRFAADARTAAEKLISLANQAKEGDVTPAMAKELGSVLSVLQSLSQKYPKPTAKSDEGDTDADQVDKSKKQEQDEKPDEEDKAKAKKEDDDQADADTNKSDEDQPAADVDVDVDQVNKAAGDKPIMPSRFTPAKKKAVKAALKTLVDVMAAIGIMPDSMKKSLGDFEKAVDDLEPNAADEAPVDKADDKPADDYQADQVADLQKSLEERDATITELGKRLDALEKAGVPTSLPDDGSQPGDTETKKSDTWGGLLQLNTK
jgi:hypothetical protein